MLLASVLAVSLGGCGGDGRSKKLIRAIDAGDEKMVDTLLEDEDLDLKATEDAGAPFLLHAMEGQQKAIYEKLLKKGASPNDCDSSGKCVMNQGAKKADSYWLTQALAHGGDPDALNTGNRHSPNCTPLFYAIDARLVENTKLLIDAGADVNHRNSFGLAPLHVTIGNGKYESMVALLEAGADPTQTNKHGRSFVDLFAGRDETEISARNNDQLPWFRKVREILIKRGLIKNGEKE